MSAIFPILETLQKRSFWYRQQLLFRFSFIFSIVAKRFPFIGVFSFGKRKESAGVKSDEYGLLFCFWPQTHLCQRFLQFLKALLKWAFGSRQQLLFRFFFYLLSRSKMFSFLRCLQFWEEKRVSRDQVWWIRFTFLFLATNSLMPAFYPILKLAFRYRQQLLFRFFFYLRNRSKTLSFHRYLQFWEEEKVSGIQVRWKRWLRPDYGFVFAQKLTYKHRSVSWCIIMMQNPWLVYPQFCTFLTNYFV